MTTRHLLSIDDLDADQLDRLLVLAGKLAGNRRPRTDLGGLTVALLFEKPSLRTRASFAHPEKTRRAVRASQNSASHRHTSERRSFAHP